MYDIMIFKAAIPPRKSPVVDFFFEILKNPRKFILEIKTKIPKSPHLLPLLNACEISRKEVYRQLKRVKISGPPDGRGSVHWTEDGVPARYFWKAYQPVDYTYIDPLIETLMLNIPDLIRLYRYGASIDLSKITRIALTAFATNEEDISYSNIFEDVLDLVRRICPDLKILQMLTMLSVHEYYREYNIEMDIHILDIDPEMWHTDFLDKTGERLNSDHLTRIRAVLDEAKQLDRLYPKYLTLADRSEEDLRFWRNVGYTSAMQCKFDDDGDWKLNGKSAPEPRLYIFALDAWLPAYEDGSALERYKGLAQIFEGAPW
ncbi:hypothetical protein NHQ30_006430 [Ciborinia camelliae]|nr:hypothetical protein NHQ30_006430 [Ciborinia camelliae]